MRKAFLNSAFLNGSDFSGSRISYADFEDASLCKADLLKAEITGANFTGANIDDTIFPSINLQIGKLYYLNSLSTGFRIPSHKAIINFRDEDVGMLIGVHPSGNFDLLIREKDYREIPEWVKYTGIKNQ